MVKQTTTVTYHPNDPIPEAYIAINKNRIKIYNNKNVYLKDRQSFQIELFNPTQKDILAVIYVNNQKIDGGGIILRPAERVYLERYLTENRRFMFSTYVANGTSSQIAHAIEHNGKIRVDFHNEYEIYYNENVWNNLQDFYKRSNDEYTYQTNCSDFASRINFCSSSIGDLNLSSRNAKYTKAKSVETGKIEKGSSSSQKFTYVDKEFVLVPFHSVSYHLLPTSQQKMNTSDINKVRRYCERCGVKAAKDNAKFCWNCGEAL